MKTIIVTLVIVVAFIENMNGQTTPKIKTDLRSLPDSVESVLRTKLSDSSYLNQPLILTPASTITARSIDTTWSVHLSGQTVTYKINAKVKNSVATGKVKSITTQRNVAPKVDSLSFSIKMFCICADHKKHICECDDKPCKNKMTLENKCLNWQFME